MENERLNLWKKSNYLPLNFTSSETDMDNPDIDRFISFVSEYYGRAKAIRKGEDDDKFSEITLFESAKEAIFDCVDNKPIIHLISYSIDASRGQIEVGHNLDILFGDTNKEEIREDVKRTLAVAKAFGVPVYPNTDKVAPILAKYTRDMLVDGFRAHDPEGKCMKLMLTNSPGAKIETIEYLGEISLAEMHTPAELHLIRQAVQQEVDQYKEAERILTNLRLAIGELKECLEDEGRNEGTLQETLTRNPILFGADYIRVIPKHKLGSDFEMDYALVRTSRLVDLVEIEASNHELFTKSGNPTQYLIHAEQQILDWLNWIERNHGYACEKLPGVMKPIGYVVIGRTQNMSEMHLKRLQQRKALFRGTIEILTYDDLLIKAQNLLRILEGLQVPPKNPP